MKKKSQNFLISGIALLILSCVLCVPVRAQVEKDEENLSIEENLDESWSDKEEGIVEGELHDVDIKSDEDLNESEVETNESVKEVEQILDQQTFLKSRGDFEFSQYTILFDSIADDKIRIKANEFRGSISRSNSNVYRRSGIDDEDGYYLDVYPEEYGDCTITVESFYGDIRTINVSYAPFKLSKSSVTLSDLGETVWVEANRRLDSVVSSNSNIKLGDDRYGVLYEGGEFYFTSKKFGTSEITVKSENGDTATIIVNIGNAENGNPKHLKQRKPT